MVYHKNKVIKVLLCLVCLAVAVKLNMAQVPEEYRAEKKINNEIYFHCRGMFTEEGDNAYMNSNFFDNAGNSILKEEIEYKAGSFEIVQYELEDYRTGRQEMITVRNDEYILQYKRNSGNNFRTKSIKKDGLILHGSFLPIFIIKKLAMLNNGQEISFRLLIPLRPSTEGFRLKQVGIVKVDDKECYEIKMEASSWIARRLVAPMYFYIHTEKPKRLIMYKGRLLPTDKKVNPLDGVITFSYSDF
ncbi:MAG: hypothetical protein KAX28_01020 [Candidatus Marinimicrobia bacterium]|nr:hypothetical protein [Candidatus Neomarinimicrobiota bacterium]